MRTVCGLDVHKDSIYLCILSSTGEVIEKVYGVLTIQLEEMRDLMLTHHVQEVGMESTSVYWIPVWRCLEPYFKLKLINPYFIRQLPGHKSDVKDAQWIAECLLKDLVRGSFVPPERIQQLRQYDRRIYDLDDEIIRKLAKLDAAVQRCNIRLSNYVSNTDGKSYKSFIDRICEGVTDPKALVEEVHGRIINRHGRETIIAALTGCITECDIDIMRQLKAEIDMAELHKQECMNKMQDICEKEYSTALKNLRSMPGVKMRAATSLIAEIGTDMSHFETANHLASWSGLKPRNDQSNKIVKSRRITHGNRYLRRTLIQCSWAASRTKDCFFSRFSYYQIQVRKKNKMKVQVAIARKMLVCVWHILNENLPYKDFDNRIDTSAKNG
ncbi:IS110 family transposase [Tannerella sp.]|uniref:IS110 family transposase n=1 Tax=Tannerella sp. TaxID=2382127 RepID=UPI003FA1EC6D